MSWLKSILGYNKNYVAYIDLMDKKGERNEIRVKYTSFSDIMAIKKARTIGRDVSNFGSYKIGIYRINEDGEEEQIYPVGNIIY